MKTFVQKVKPFFTESTKVAVGIAIGLSLVVAGSVYATVSVDPFPPQQEEPGNVVRSSAWNSLRQELINVVAKVAPIVRTDNNIGIGGGVPSGSGLRLFVDGKVGATAYCDQNGANCSTPPFGSGGGSSAVVMPQAYGIYPMECKTSEGYAGNGNPLGNNCATLKFSGVDIKSADLNGGQTLFRKTYTAGSDGQLRIMATIPVRYVNSNWYSVANGNACETISWTWEGELGQTVNACKNNWEQAIMATIWINGAKVATGDIINPEQLSGYSDGGTGTVLGSYNVNKDQDYEIEVKLVSFGNNQVVDKLGLAGTIKTIDHEVEGYVEFTEYGAGGDGSSLPTCSNNQILKYDTATTSWVCADNGGGGWERYM
jgi:hypothetical protein